MSHLKQDQKSIRVVMPEALYNALKRECPEYGDLSKLIRRLLLKHLEQLAEEHQHQTADEPQS